MNSTDRLVGNGSFRYRALASWPRLPAGFAFNEVAGVATDSKNQVFVFSRSESPVSVFTPEGEFLYSWGKGLVQRPHGIAIDRDDNVWLTDDVGQTVRKFTPKGELLLTL